jgi:hypothetical protein
LHAVIGGLSGQPHWFINDADAKRYGQAMANAARHFPLRATQKALDVSMLMITAFSIEAPRIVLSMQLAKQGHPRPQRGPAQVFQFHNPNAPASPTTPANPPPPAGGAGVTSQGAMDAPPDFSADPGAIGGEPAA